MSNTQYGYIGEVDDLIKGRPGKRKIYGCDEAFRAQFLEWRKANSHLSDEVIGSQIGRSNTLVYHYSHPRGNLYAGDTALLEKKLAEYMRDCRLELDTNVPTVAGEISNQIEEAVEEIRTAKRIGVIIGPPGIGKSRGINLYSESHELAIAFRVSSWNKSQSDFAECLHKAAGLDQDRRGLSNMKLLVEKMTGSNRQFLIDDAHKLTRAALQLAYDFRDATGSPIALFGDERLIAKLKDDAQRLRRTGIVRRLKISDPDALIRHHIAAFCADVGQELGELVKLCRKIVDGPGHFGSLQMELSLAARIKRGAAEFTWCEAVRGAHQRLIRDYTL